MVDVKAAFRPGWQSLSDNCCFWIIGRRVSRSGTLSRLVSWQGDGAVAFCSAASGQS
ncbi:MAG: hypothetical protein IJO13_09950 [Lachnospiraceae bacterium]|nr:hypothetical protein [Lachnospiraceae bacterium]